MSDITLVTLFYNIGRETWGLYPRKVVEYLAAFETFLEYDYKMIIFVDYRYFDELNEKVKNSKFNNKDPCDKSLSVNTGCKLLGEK